MNWKELYDKTVNILDEIGIEEKKSESDIIFDYCFGMDKIKIIIDGNEEAPESALKKINEIASQRKKGIPVQYILGEWHFRNLKFKVGPGVLIPRDDTNVLVDVSVDFLNLRDNPSVIDLCSGSGCVAIPVEKELNSEHSEVFGVELSEEAFNYFKSNIQINRSGVKAICGDILEIYNEFCDDKFDAIISNPPYIKTEDIKNLQKEVKSEPNMALDGGNDGLWFYRNICKNWVPKLKIDGMVAFEIGFGQESEVKKLMEDAGLKCICTYTDMNNIIRVISGIKKNPTP